MRETRITTLVENQPGAHRTLRAEHGLSFLVEYGGRRFLFDTGSSDAFVDNATTLNIDLSSVEHVVLSHGHYDHTNGFPALVRGGSRPVLHVHDRFFDRKLSARGPARTYIGPSWDRRWCTASGVTVETVTGTGEELFPGVHLVTGFERTHPLETANPRFVVQRDTGTAEEIDDFRDEVSVVLETPDGLVVLVGCSHPGIMNMLDTIRRRFSAPIHAVLGGTHLVEASGKRLEEALAYLQDASIAVLGLSHCTGEEAMARLERTHATFYRNTTGSSFHVKG